MKALTRTLNASAGDETEEGFPDAVVVLPANTGFQAEAGGGDAQVGPRPFGRVGGQLVEEVEGDAPVVGLWRGRRVVPYEDDGAVELLVGGYEEVAVVAAGKAGPAAARVRSLVPADGVRPA